MTLLERYIAEYPNRMGKVLEKFDNIEKMTIDDLQAVVDKFDPIYPSSADTYKINIKSYIEWLNKNGAETIVKPEEINALKFSLRQNDYVIFDDASLHKAWRRFFDSAEELNKNFDNKRVLVTYAASILLFHGMTVPQLMALKLNQVHDDGAIDGYENIVLTPKDQAIVMNYKYMKVSANRKKLVGDTYIRSSIEEVSEDFLYRQFSRVKVSDADIKTNLGIKNIILAGQFNRIYQLEKKYGEVEYNHKIPDWFSDILNEGEEIAPATFVNRRRQYQKYRQQRKEWEAVKSEMEVSSEPIEKEPQHSDVAELLERLDQTRKILYSAMQEIECIENELKKLKI